MLKVFAAEYINIQENLSNKDKISLLNFVKESNEEQVNCLLLTGHMVSIEESTQIFSNLNEYAYMNWTDTIRGIEDFDKAVAYLEKVVKYVSNQQAAGAERFGISTGLKAGQEVGLKQGIVAGVGASAIAALIIFASIKAYKRFLSKAAKACKGKSGDEKTLCMKNYKKRALSQQIIDLKKGKRVCSKTKNPKKCILGIDKKAKKLQTKFKLM